MKTETQNVTLALPKALVKKLKVVAAKRDTSMSRLMTQLLEDLVREDDEYRELWAREEEVLRRGLDMRVGEITWTRDELHER